MKHMENQWHRLECLLGTECLDILKRKHVLIVGLGGVGGYVMEGLIRSGIGHFTIVDHDVIDITNLNRQILSLHSTVGKKKVIVAQERAFDINPNAQIRMIPLFVDHLNIEQIFDQDYDYVIDACDTVDAKKLLIERCIQKKIPIISCMGTARKLDPTKLAIMDIRKTNYDPLARVIRKYMKDTFPNYKLMVLSSSEIPQKKEEQVLASSIFVPATAGLLIAHFVVSDLSQ